MHGKSQFGFSLAFVHRFEFQGSFHKLEATYFDFELVVNPVF